MPLPLSLPFELPSDDATVDAYTRQLKALLPPGVAFDLELDSEVTKTLTATAGELARVDARGANLIDESDPRTAEETIADWERMLRLPDDLVLEIPASLEERRVAVTQKYVSRGGQNGDFFVQLVRVCGYSLSTIIRYANSVLRMGGRIGQRLYGRDYAYSMALVVNRPSGPALSQSDFERVIRHAAHAHVHVIFFYTG